MLYANGKLLIVDDEPSIRMSLSHVFAGLGHEVRTAIDGLSALVEIQKELPDILLSDLNMPGVSGFELLSIVRCHFATIQVVAMSGAFSGDAVPPGVAADAFYEKGTSLRPLFQVVRAMTEGERPRSIDRRISWESKWAPGIAERRP